MLPTALVAIASWSIMTISFRKQDEINNAETKSQANFERGLPQAESPIPPESGARACVESVAHEAREANKVLHDEWLKRRAKWYERDVTSLFLGEGFDLPHDWFTISGDTAMEAINEFQKEVLDPIYLSLNDALARGLVIILGPPFGKPKLAISMSRKAHLSPDAKGVIWTFFDVDPWDEIDIAPRLTARFTADSSVKVIDLLGISE
jgi:hypothetical protein